MGSGKSTIGPILANTLGFDYLDVDRHIEQKTKKQEIYSCDLSDFGVKAPAKTIVALSTASFKAAS